MRKIFAFVLALTFGAGTTFAIDGALSGKFTINLSGSQVQFSQGNLQYKAAPTPTWQFATNQWDTIGIANKNIADDYEGWIDLFGWGTGANPTMHTTAYSDYASYTDWGVNPISNGGNVANAWRTLSRDEWYHLLYYRDGASSKYGQATVNGHYGLVILPDEWTLPEGLTFTASPNNWTTNVYDAAAWDKMATNGAVFLPYSQIRQGTEVDYFHPKSVNYWSATPSSNSHSWEIGFREEKIIIWDTKQNFYGCCVRLVHDLVVPAVGDTIKARSASNMLVYTITSMAPNKVQLEAKGHTLVNHKLIIPSSVEYLGQHFAVTALAQNEYTQFPGIDTLRLPASFNTEIWTWRFNAPALKAFEVEASNTNFSVLDGVLYSADKTKLYICPVKNPFHNNFASGVKIIQQLAFNNCTELAKEIQIPNTVETLSTRAFYGTPITRIDIPASVTSLGDNTFGACASLAEINFEDLSNLRVTSNSFAGTKILADQSEDGLRHIGGLAVGWNVTQVEGKRAWPDTLVIPEGIENIATGFWYNCGRPINEFSTIKQIVLPSTIKYVHGSSFCESSSQTMANLESVIIKTSKVPNGGYIKFLHGGTLTLLVPCGAAETFKSNAYWKIDPDRFNAIEEGLVYTVEASAEANGSVAISDTTDCNQVTITATPDEGYIFTQWSNGVMEATIDITVDKDTNLVASFRKVPAVGDTLRYAYKGNNLYYRILYKQANYKTVGLVNDGTPATYWTEANEPKEHWLFLIASKTGKVRSTP